MHPSHRFSPRRILVLLACVLLVASSALAGERKIKLNNSAWTTLDHPVTVYFSIKPCELLNTVSGDKFDVRIHPSHTLVGMKDGYQSVITGMTPFNLIWPAATPGAFPLLDLFSLPGLFPNQATSNAVLRDLFAKYPQFEAEIDPAVVRISSQVHMRCDLHTRMPIRSLAELKGKTIGCQNQQVAEALAVLGASTTILEIPDAYAALDKGVVDGMAGAWGMVSATRLTEVAKYHTLLGICPAASHFLANRKIVWDNLTPEQRSIMKQLEPTFQSLIVKGNVESSMDVRFRDASPEKGHEMITWSQADMDAMRAKFRPIWDKWAADMEKKGLPGKSILEDAIRLVAAYTYG
ncbi:TRAP transporter substrate-binding protein DctP [Desulfovibrio aminophilus]|uniref:TRAP transporter substrate-binding protein n=1 Tax=Desulfovibrio aminophilus TaxID=81425 RepID=UPI00339B5E22